MPVMYEIRYDPEERRVGFAGSRGNYYELANGSHLDLQSEPVWCRWCVAVTHGESVETLARIEREVADLHNPSSDVYRFVMTPLVPDLETTDRTQFRLDTIAAAEARRRWRTARRSRPRCLKCGTTEIVALPINHSVAIPGGGGAVTLSVIGLCSTSFNEWFFTPEGERIVRDTKPTYWHHPFFD